MKSQPSKILDLFKFCLTFEDTWNSKKLTVYRVIRCQPWWSCSAAGPAGHIGNSGNVCLTFYHNPCSFLYFVNYFVAPHYQGKYHPNDGNFSNMEDYEPPLTNALLNVHQQKAISKHHKIFCLIFLILKWSPSEKMPCKLLFYFCSVREFVLIYGFQTVVDSLEAITVII